MGTRHRTHLLTVLLLAWVILPPSIHAQPAGTKGWAIGIRVIVLQGPVRQRGFMLQLKVKDQMLFFVRRHFFPDEAEVPMSEIGADFTVRPGAETVELQGSEELLAGLLREEPGQRVLELRGVYDSAVRVLHLSAVQPVEQYTLFPLFCPPLPAMGPANQVSLHVAKEPDRLGRVCARVINRLSAEVSYGYPVGRFQVWEEGWWWRPGRFADVPPDPIVMYSAVRLSLLPGEARDDRLPHSYRPAPPGRYRVCFRYEFPAWPPGSKKEVCSEEFMLP